MKVNERRVKFNRNPAKAKRSVTKLGRFAESRGNSGNHTTPRLQEGRFAETSSRLTSGEQSQLRITSAAKAAEFGVGTARTRFVYTRFPRRRVTLYQPCNTHVERVEL